MLNCKSYEGCSAPLCPLDKSFKYAVWYPDETICKKRELSQEARKVIKVQKKTTRRTTHKELCFDSPTLLAIKRVDTRIRGRDTDKVRNPRVNEALILQPA